MSGYIERNYGTTDRNGLMLPANKMCTPIPEYARIAVDLDEMGVLAC